MGRSWRVLLAMQRRDLYHSKDEKPLNDPPSSLVGDGGRSGSVPERDRQRNQDPQLSQLIGTCGPWRWEEGLRINGQLIVLRSPHQSLARSYLIQLHTTFWEEIAFSISRLYISRSTFFTMLQAWCQPCTKLTSCQLADLSHTPAEGRRERWGREFPWMNICIIYFPRAPSLLQFWVW